MAARVDAVGVVLGVIRLVLYFNKRRHHGPLWTGVTLHCNLHGPLVGVGDVTAHANCHRGGKSAAEALMNLYKGVETS